VSVVKSPPIEKIHDYQLQTFIGSGVNASVYLASNNQHKVAIKLRRRSEGSYEPLLLKRFYESVRLHHMLCHPNLVWLYDWYEDEEYQAVILEYVSGGTLTDLCKMKRSWSRLELCTLGVAIADGLDHMHDIRIVHRDLKPDNLIFGDLNNLASIKITDLGVSKHSLWSPSITEPGSHVGTMWYSSPEQFDQAKPHPMFDIYSLGIILYEVATGRLPFEPLTMPTLMRRFLDHSPLASLTKYSSVGESYEWIVNQAASSHREQRIPNVATLAALLMLLEPSLLQSYHRAYLLLRRTDQRWIENALNKAPTHIKAELYPHFSKVFLEA
jgi:eukaryotic-like serine/threonine-protein kinase